MLLVLARRHKGIAEHVLVENLRALIVGILRGRMLVE